MSRGKRYDTEPKLNIKKVIAVMVAIAVIIMFMVAIKSLLKSDAISNQPTSTAYFLINENNQWGVMDNHANIVIEPTYEEAIIIPDHHKDIFICTTQVDYEKNTYQTKAMNSKNRELYKEYNQVMPLENYDEDHNLWYENNVLLVQKDGKYGLINFDGKEILQPVFDNIETLKGTKNSLITSKEGKKGLVNNLGESIIENKYDEIISLGENTQRYIVKENNQYGIEGIFPCQYEEIIPLNQTEIFCVKTNQAYQVINQAGETVFNEKFDYIKEIQDHILIYQYQQKEYAYDLENGKKLAEPYQELIYTNHQFMIAKDGSNYGIIDSNNQVKVEKTYANIQYYKDADIYELEKKNQNVNVILNGNLQEITTGIVNEINVEKNYIKIWTENGYEYYQFNGKPTEAKEIFTQHTLFLRKQNGKYGYVDQQGNVVVDYLYDDATEQNEAGYLAVKKDGLWGCMDGKGNLICETKYNLDDYLLVDFIGQYHLGKDLNLNYYTKKE